MGKTKSKKKVVAKRKPKLSTAFKCPFCAHEMSCTVALHRDRDVGEITCQVCMEKFQCPITALSEPIDVYAQWIDACEAARAPEDE